jgi:WD40 repeat protein
MESCTQISSDWRDEEEETGVNTIALSPYGKTIASGCDDGKVRLWDIETGKVIARWSGHPKYVRSVCWRRDGKQVLSGSNDGTVRVWNVDTGETILEIETGHDNVWAVIYSPDTTKFATGGYSNSAETGVKIRDAKSGELLLTLKHADPVRSLVWTSDNKKIISSSFQLIRIFNTSTWQEIAILEGHSHYVNTITVSPNNRMLASASYDNTVRL